MHDATKVQMGTTRSSSREVDNRKGTISAGLAVRLNADGSITNASGSNSIIGVSLGKDLSDAGRTAICRKGLGVPLRVNFTPTVGAQVHIADATGMGAASGAGATGVNAVYVSGVLTGVMEDGTTEDVALIDMPGGL